MRRWWKSSGRLDQAKRWLMFSWPRIPHRSG
jgi:hypothetical protein